MTTTFNLATGEPGPTYNLRPREAVIAAHAQSLGDWSTWAYDATYGDGVVMGFTTIRCGDFTARTIGGAA